MPLTFSEKGEPFHSSSASFRVNVMFGPGSSVTALAFFSGAWPPSFVNVTVSNTVFDISQVPVAAPAPATAFPDATFARRRS